MMEKIWNSGLGIVLAVLAVMVVFSAVNSVSWSLYRIVKYAVVAGIAVCAVNFVQNRRKDQ